MSTIIFSKINLDQEIDPNTASPKLEIYDRKVKLFFPLRSEKLGCIEFINCRGLRSGSPNDEGYYKYNDGFWNINDYPEIEWHSFYEIKNAPLEYLNQFYIQGEKTELSNPSLKHYAFFMKEGTFECLAEDYREEVVD
ncbi:MAG: hypothetical protein JWN64_228 [Parcubacteria group bacterium]|nr:hypothetical protein [Parcubacteria group bacterium]